MKLPQVGARNARRLEVACTCDAALPGYGDRTILQRSLSRSCHISHARQLHINAETLCHASRSPATGTRQLDHEYGAHTASPAACSRRSEPGHPLRKRTGRRRKARVGLVRRDGREVGDSGDHPSSGHPRRRRCGRCRQGRGIPELCHGHVRRWGRAGPWRRSWRADAAAGAGSSCDHLGLSTRTLPGRASPASLREPCSFAPGRESSVEFRAGLLRRLGRSRVIAGTLAAPPRRERTADPPCWIQAIVDLVGRIDLAVAGRDREGGNSPQALKNARGDLAGASILDALEQGYDRSRLDLADWAGGQGSAGCRSPTGARSGRLCSLLIRTSRRVCRSLAGRQGVAD